jgi:hypothetical protein
MRGAPHAGLAAALAGLGPVVVGLQGAGSVCSCSPVYHWARCGLAIRCPAVRCQLVGLVGDSETRSVLPKSFIITNCYNAHSRIALLHP